MKKNFAIKKIYYSISEVSKITDLEQHVLRYWETEFEQLKPGKNLAGNRIYTNNDIKLILYIKKLLREEKYTISGAKKLLKSYSIKSGETASKKSSDRNITSANKDLKYSEMSLFTQEDSAKDSDELKEIDLKRDLIELKTFLSELLKTLNNEQEVDNFNNR